MRSLLRRALALAASASGSGSASAPKAAFARSLGTNASLFSLWRRDVSSASGSTKKKGTRVGAGLAGSACFGIGSLFVLATGTADTSLHLDASTPSTSSSNTQLDLLSKADNLTNGLSRSLIFWFYAMPIYFQYKGFEWYFKGSEEEESAPYWEFLHKRHAPTVEHVCLLLKGFYLKGAQVASTRDDLIPKEYLDFCKAFQDEVPSELAGKGDVEEAICRSLGISDVHEVFESIEEKPLGAASIGVVHKAKLRDGRVVAVKLQFPGIEERFRNDLKTVKTFCTFALPSHLPFLNEIEKQFMTEFDYVAEAENLDRIRKQVLPAWKRHLYIPYVIKELCTKKVMVMEYLEGTNLLRSVVQQYERYAAKQGLTLAQLAEKDTAARDKKKGSGSRSGSSGGGSSLALESAKVYLAKRIIQVGDLSLNTGRFLYNATVGKITRTSLRYQWSEHPINLARALDILMRVHAYEIFCLGLFNADPHPGNIMLLKDGRIGLIDYGQVKEISLEKRLKYAQLISHIAREEKTQTCDHATTHMGLKTKHMNYDIIYKLLAFFHDRDTDDVTSGMNIQQFMDWANEVDPIIDLDDDYVLCGRVSLLLRGLGNAFNLKLRVTQYWKEEAERLLKTEKRSF